MLENIMLSYQESVMLAEAPESGAAATEEVPGQASL